MGSADNGCQSENAIGAYDSPRGVERQHREVDPYAPFGYSSRYQEAGWESDKQGVIRDYVAGMTESYASRVYECLFVPGVGKVFVAYRPGEPCRVRVCGWLRA